MRNKTVMLLPLLLALSTQARAVEPAGADCTCAEAFERVVAGVETDYAGFRIKVDAHRREAYDGFKSMLRADAAGAGPDRCKQVLDTYAGFFQDHHVFVLRYAKAGGPGGKTARPWTEARARQEIDRHRERLDPVEGIWYSRSARYAVLHEAGAPAGSFFAVRLAAGGKASSELVAVLQRGGRGEVQVTYRDGQGQWQNGLAALHRGGSLLVFGIEEWGRLHPLGKSAGKSEARLDPVDPKAPFFTRLDADTLYISIPSYLGEYRQPLDTILAAHGAEIAKARGLVIDVRGNGGGDGIDDGLAPYMLTGPIQLWEDSAILSSERNLRFIERFRAPLGDEGKVFDPALQRMRENPGKIVPYLDSRSYTPPVVSPGPRRVAVLIDRGVGSAVEAMLVLARQSPRVILVGENTRGNIDYQQVVTSIVGCGDHAYLLGAPLYMRSRSLPAGALDVLGVTPDVPVADHLADPLTVAVRLLAEGG